MPLTLITAPASEPITAATAKLHAKVDVSADDSLFTTLIAAVRERCELATSRGLITQTWDWVLDRFPNDDFLEIPRPPLQSVTSVTYKDSAGTAQTWASTNYVVQAPSGPRAARGRLALAYGKSWPSTYGQMGDVTIRFVCGYGTAGSDVPSLLIEAMLLDLTTLYRNRETVTIGSMASVLLPGGAHDIYWSYRSAATQRLVAA